MTSLSLFRSQRYHHNRHTTHRHVNVWRLGTWIMSKTLALSQMILLLLLLLLLPLLLPLQQQHNGWNNLENYTNPIFGTSIFCTAWQGIPQHVERPITTTTIFSHNMDDLQRKSQFKHVPAPVSTKVDRRSFMQHSMKSISLLFLSSSILLPSTEAMADEESDFFDDPEIKELYDNPNIPQAPEERSGLVVLRVAEVAQFQEKILRSIASGEVQGVMVSPMQFAFGTQILLRNSNLDGNIKLMIQEEIPRKRRKDAAKIAASVLNQLQEIGKFSASIQRDFETIEMVQLADMYRSVRVNLNELYEFLPEKEKEKYYGYFVAVTAYEKKIAEGTYNPDLDGILNFD